MSTESSEEIIARARAFLNRKVKVNNRGKHDLQIIGAGFSRSGSWSLAKGLMEMGYDTWHPLSCVSERELTKGLIWWKGKSQQIINDGDSINYDEFFDFMGGKYTAVIDWPSYFFWEELSEFYPNSKVILSVRDKEKWWSSAKMAVNVWYMNPFKHLMTPVHDLFGVIEELTQISLKDFGGYHAFMNNRETTFQMYDERVEKLKKKFEGTDRLLLFNVKDGWKPLCEFLGHDYNDYKDRPFPYANEGADFAKGMAQGMFEETVKFVFSKMIYLIPIVGLLLGYYFYSTKQNLPNQQT